MITEKVKSFVLGLCKKHCTEQDWEWENHVKFVVEQCKKLASQLNADSEIVELAAWLHDIKKIKKEKGNHHVKGAEEAREVLFKFGYDNDKTEQVVHCILTHSSDKKYIPETIEAKILVSVDAYAVIDDFVSFCSVPYRKGLSIPEAKEWSRSRYKSTWNKICIDDVREMSRKKYEMIMFLLGE